MRFIPREFPLVIAGVFLMLAVAFPVQAWEAAGPYPFGVLNHRSVTLTAEYWNPILTYVGKKTGVALELHIARTANETTDMATRGELAFAYTNHLFTPEREKLGFTVLARQEGDGIRGQVVVREDSPVKALKELDGQKVAFANPYGFTGYFVPYDALLRAGAKPVALFAGTQESAMGQLMHGQVAAAGVNSQVMADFARREKFAYRVLADSEPYFDLCVMAHPKVPRAAIAAVKKAFVEMKDDPAGRAVLEASAQLLSAKPRAFTAANDRDYDNYRHFFHATLVPLSGQ